MSARSGVSTILPSHSTSRAGIHLRPLHRLPMTEMSNNIRHHGPDPSPGSPLSSFASCRRPQALRVSNFATLRPDQWCQVLSIPISPCLLTFIQLLSTEMRSRFHNSEPMVASWAEVHFRRELENDIKGLSGQDINPQPDGILDNAVVLGGSASPGHTQILECDAPSVHVFYSCTPFLIL